MNLVGAREFLELRYQSRVGVLIDLPGNGQAGGFLVAVIRNTPSSYTP